MRFCLLLLFACLPPLLPLLPGGAVLTSCSHVWVEGCTALVTVLLATLLTALVTGVLTTTQPLAIILTSNALRNTTPLVHRNIAYEEPST